MLRHFHSGQHSDRAGKHTSRLLRPGPGGLDNAKSHVLLCLDVWIKDFAAMNGTIDDRFAFGMWIERCNVRLV